MQSVKHPVYYRAKKKFETWDWIERGLPDEEFIGFLKGNVLKYLHRYDKKGGKADLEKAKEYIDKLINFEYGDSE